MKTNLKGIMALLLCVFSVLMLFACVDNSEKNPGGTQDSSPEQTTVPEQTTEPEQTTAPEQTTEPVSTVTPIAEAMRIEKGYTVTSEQTFDIIGEEKKQMTR